MEKTTTRYNPKTLRVEKKIKPAVYLAGRGDRCRYIAADILRYFRHFLLVSLLCH